VKLNFAEPEQHSKTTGFRSAHEGTNPKVSMQQEAVRALVFVKCFAAVVTCAVAFVKGIAVINGIAGTVEVSTVHGPWG
jgi:hypothetical protein